MSMSRTTSHTSRPNLTMAPVSSDRGRPGVVGRLHNNISQHLRDSFSTKKRWHRQYSTSPPASIAGVPKKQRIQIPGHDRANDRDKNLPEELVGVDRESNDSDSVGSSHPTQIFDWDRDADSHCHWTSEPSSTSDSPRSTHTAQFSQATRASTRSSQDLDNPEDVDNADLRPSSSHSDVHSTHHRPPISPLNDVEIAHVGLGLAAEGFSQTTTGASGDEMAYPGPDEDETASTQSDEPTLIHVDLRAPRPASQSDRNDGSSTEGDSKSSQQQDTEEESGFGDELSQLINRVLGPIEGRQFYAAARGTLSYMPRQKVKSIDELSGLSLLDVAHLDIAGVMPYTIAAPESNGGTSESSSHLGAGRGESSGGSSSTPQNSSRGGGGDKTNNNQSGQDKSAPTAKPGETDQVTSSARRRNLRCPFNARLPELFCVTQKTGRKFAPCEAPGYNTMQYLKEHVQKTHRPPKDKNKDLPKCGCCQETFETKELLQDHMDNVDCPVRCAECKQEFNSKPARKTHHDKEHAVSDANQIDITYIDDEKYAEMKSLLKAYSESLRKGKRTQNPQLENWILNNTEAFLQGRDPEINPQLQLGQWHIMFTTLFPGSAVPEHPFYDLEDVAMKGEEVIEKIMYIWKLVLKTKREVHGQLPTDPEQSLRFYEDVQRQTLMLSADTTLLRSVIGKIHISNDEVLGRDLGTQSSAQATSRHNPNFLGLPQQPLVSGDIMQAQIQPVSTNPQSGMVFPVDEHPIQQYGSAVEGDAVNPFDYLGWTTTQDANASPYNAQASPQFYNMPVPYDAYPVLPGNAYQTQPHSRARQAQPQQSQRPVPDRFGNSGRYLPRDGNMRNSQQ